MNSLPLHPAIVHLPLGLAMLMPLFALGFGWALWTGRLRPRAWIAVVALQGLLLGSALVATNTGSAQEDRVERLVPKSAIHQHEEFAEQFTWAAGVTLALTGLVLAFGRPAASKALTVVAVGATVVVAGLALRVGHAGGQLVYVHGAAGAYVTTSSGATGTGSAAKPLAGDDDDKSGPAPR